jgi:excisionase family DNA binding protein
VADSCVMTVPEAVTFCRLGRTTLYGLMDRGDLPHIKIGRRRLVERAALLDLLRRSRVSR